MTEENRNTEEIITEEAVGEDTAAEDTFSQEMPEETGLEEAGEEETGEKMSEEEMDGEEEYAPAAKKGNIFITIFKYIIKIFGYSCLFLLPFLSYYLFEYVTGNLENIPAFMAFLNVCWIYVLYLALTGIAGTTRISVPVVSIALLLISFAETFVVDFRDRPIMIWDVLAVRTAMTVSGNYVFDISDKMIQAAKAVIGANIFLWFFPVHAKHLKMKLVLRGFCIGTAAAFVFGFYNAVVPIHQLGINMWSVNETYNSCGYILSTALSFQYVVKKPPVEYSHSKLETIYEELLSEDEENLYQSNEILSHKAETQPVNLICIMNESLSDLRVVGDFSTNQEYLPFINSLTKNTVKGNLCMPVFGSMTSNSEFEFLTGDSVAMLPSNSIAYQFNVQPNTWSMVSTVRAQGYRAVAMHPYPGENWNRKTCYANMGFDEFLDRDFFEGSEQLRYYTSDQGDFEKVIQAVEEKEDPQDKLFIFNVTMQNHGGYEGTFDEFDQTVWLTGDMEGKYPKADQYLSLVKRSDDAFAYLLDYFSHSDEPTMIVMFGDHQPSVEDEFFDEIYGTPSSEVPVKDRLMWYETPFVIWTNYDQPSKDMGKLGAVYLSSYVLKLAGLDMPLYNQFLLNMSQTYPVLHFLGFYDKEGNYQSWSEAESEDNPNRKQVLDYETMAYDHSIDNYKDSTLFTVREKHDDTEE